MSNRQQLANIFQIAAHGAMGQKRKYSGIPYHTHPQAVVAILKAHVPYATETMICAAYLHDILEDTGWTFNTLMGQFDADIVGIVNGLTNSKYYFTDGTPVLNRAAQKRVDANRMARQPWEVKVIKLCDRLHNLPDIIANDSKFAAVYVPETRYLLDTALTGVHDVLWNKLDAIVKQWYEENTCVQN